MTAGLDRWLFKTELGLQVYSLITNAYKRWFFCKKCLEINLIKEVIVVEGKDDISAVKKAVDAEIIATNGFGFPKDVRERIKKAAETRAIIVLTDPDCAGEKIRKEIISIAGNCKHAYIPRELAVKDDDIGVENASPEAILMALESARCQLTSKRTEFTNRDLLDNDLLMGNDSRKRRDLTGQILGIGYANAKQFLSRLNN